jgi:hypothetical protein
MDPFRKLEINGGCVKGSSAENYLLTIPAVSKGYADAQVDDYGGLKRRDYRWSPGTRMTLQAKFSHPEDQLVGTAGFGFWNAPYGDPTVPWPTLPQTAWFFYGSAPTDLPLAKEGVGQGWFASTLNARAPSALALIPASPAVILLNQFECLRQRIWPPIRRRLGITFRPLQIDMTEWHAYRLDWEALGCAFFVDGEAVLQTSASPGGPMGFVCWIDNQYLALTVRGRLGWGILPTHEEQTLSLRNLELNPI